MDRKGEQLSSGHGVKNQTETAVRQMSPWIGDDSDKITPLSGFVPHETSWKLDTIPGKE